MPRACLAAIAVALCVPALSPAAVSLTKTRAERTVSERALRAYGPAVSGEPSATATCTAAKGERFVCRYVLSGTAGKRMIGRASVWRERSRVRSRVARPTPVSRTTLAQAKPVAERAVAARHPGGKTIVRCTSVKKTQVLNAKAISCEYVTVLPDGDQRAGTVKLAVSLDGVAHATGAPAARTKVDVERMYALKTGTQPAQVTCDDFEATDREAPANGHSLDCQADPGVGKPMLFGTATVSSDGTITVSVTPPTPAPSAPAVPSTPAASTPSGSSLAPCYSCGSTYVPGYYVPGYYVPGEYVSGVGYIPGTYVPGVYIPGGYY